MSDLFGRAYVLQIGDRQITGLRVTFKVTKTADAKHNRAMISVFNLNAASRRQMQDGKPVVVTLSAGYGSSVTQIFSGKLSRVWHTHEGPDWETHLDSDDGKDALGARVSLAIANGNRADMAKKIAADLAEKGIGAGNLDAALAEIAKAAETAQSQVQHGSAEEALGSTLDPLGLEYTVQDGQLQVVKKGQILNREAALLSAKTGLIGSPDVGKKGYLKVKCLIQPNLVPQWGIVVNSDAIANTLFRIEKVTYRGDSHGTEWFADLELAPSEEKLEIDDASDEPEED